MPMLTRCAVYTRVSTEEGLGQAFNSLDAQKEACTAYITSQRHEGWTLAPGDYDDGGFSGGTMERPGLKRLLEEVRAGRVEVIVVYKVDRLTRNLGDFARIVDVLDAADASFVSVTQSFNTTTSMGRLTLNVLLSFAQFEREVTGERIRDKIAASKAKGIWMGGVVPLGYDVRQRKLVINEPEAETVGMIFRSYLALGSVLALQADLEEKRIQSKQRTNRSGNAYGGKSMSRGALYLLLQNRIYIGQICHKGTAHPGEHEGIVDPGLFEAVQAQLERNRIDRSDRAYAGYPSLLAGILWDEHGRRMSPSHAVKQVKRYRYYVSRAEGESKHLPIWRVPAGDLEELVIGRVRGFLADSGAVHDSTISAEDDAVTVERTLFAARLLAQQLDLHEAREQRRRLLALVHRVEVHRERVLVNIDAGALLRLSETGGEPTRTLRVCDPIVINAPAKLARIGNQVRLVVAPAHGNSRTRRDPALIKLIVKAHAARAAVEQRSSETVREVAQSQGHAREYFRVLLRISYLAPDITCAILNGAQPEQLTRQTLARMSNLPRDWQAQRQMLGFPK
jgi:DNA invertase Pin-like site-specific DNA recombinase